MPHELWDAWPLLRQSVDEAIEDCGDGEANRVNYCCDFVVMRARPNHRVDEQRRLLGLPNRESPNGYEQN